MPQSAQSSEVPSRLLVASLMLALVGCGGREPQPPAPTAAVVDAGLPAPRDPALEYGLRPPTHTERAFGVFRVVHDSRPHADWDMDRWDRVQVFRDGQRLLDVTSDELGANLTVHEATGRDLTGDGVPEIVLSADSGGNQCCEGVVIYSVTPTVHRIARESSAFCTHLEDLDGDGVPELVTCDVAPNIPAAEELRCSMAEQPTPTVIYHYEAATDSYRLSTPTYRGRRHEALRRAVSDAEARWPDEPCALYGAALEVLYAGDRREAERLLQRLRPVGCEGADCAARSVQFSADLRAQLWDWVRKSDQYLARPDAAAHVLARYSLRCGDAKAGYFPHCRSFTPRGTRTSTCCRRSV